MTNLEYALAYAAMGWPVFPLHNMVDGRCSCGRDCKKSAGKHPRTVNGVKDASAEPAVIEAWWTRNPEANIGIATGAVSGLVVIDIDPRNGGNATIDELEARNGRLPDTVLALTGGGGRHFCFRYRAGVPHGLGAGIDVKTDGGYIVAAPSNHESGNHYAWEASSDPLEGMQLAELPAWVLRERVQRQVDVSAQWRQLPPNEIRRIRSALAFIPSEEREVWVEIAMALKSTGAEEQVYGLWIEWSQQSEKFDARDSARVWRSISPHGTTTIASLFYEAERRGWVAPEAVVEAGIAPEPEPVLAGPAAERERLPAQLLRVPGALQLLVDHINTTAPVQQPILAVAGALSFGATVMARRFAYEGLRTNLYICGIAPTGRGKEHARKCIDRAVFLAGIEARLGGEEIKSGAGLLSRAQMNPDALFMIDEFGMLMGGINGVKAESYQTDIMSVLMKLYSKTDGKYRGAEYSDQRTRPRQDVEFPCINVYATTTAEKLLPALESSALVSGFLNRWTFVETETPDADINWDRSDARMPEAVGDWAKRLLNLQPQGLGNLVGASPGSPIPVTATPGAKKLLRGFSEFCSAEMKKTRGTGLDAVFVRAWEQSAKTAMILAGSCCGPGAERPVVTDEIAYWAVSWQKHWTLHMLEIARSRIADSQWGALMNAIWSACREQGEVGHSRRTLSHVCAKYRNAKPREREEALQALLMDGRVISKVVQGARGPATERLFAVTGDGNE